MDVLIKRGYEGFQRLDSGGQANVYKSYKAGKAFAIKVVHVENPNNAKLDDDLKRELQIVRNVKHPNCIHVEDLFRTKNKVYIIMDFMPNGTIGSVVRKNGPLCEWNAKLWFCPIARSIKYLHWHEIAHRDLKLDNILLDGHLNPILTDFGFSRFVRTDSNGMPIKSDTYCGTMSYNPPEILKQIPYDPFKGDIWCLGVMLFIMINQVYPFDRHEGKERMYENQLRRNYRLQDSIAPKVSNEIKDLLRIMLEPVPEKRPTISELCEHGWFPIILHESEWLSMQYSGGGGSYGYGGGGGGSIGGGASGTGGGGGGGSSYALQPNLISSATISMPNGSGNNNNNNSNTMLYCSGGNSSNTGGGAGS